MGVCIDERHYTPQELAKSLRVDQDSVYQWIHRGVVRDGRRVHLRAVRPGRYLRVPQSALDAFLVILNPEQVEHPPQPPTPTAARRQAEAAKEELRAMLAPKGRKGARP
jgi:excisionase family DNA binding protein